MRARIPAALLLAACAADAAPPAVVRHDSAGVEIADVQALPSLLDDAWRWSDTVEVAIRTQVGRAAPVVYNPRDLLPLPGGRLLVLDDQADLLLLVVMDEDGRVLARFGPRGAGPGELSGDVVLWPGPEQTAWVADRGNDRLLRFALDGALLSERRLEARLATVPPEAWPTWTAVDDPLEHPLFAALSAGDVVMRGGESVAHVYTPDGRLVRRIRLPLTRRSLGEREIAAARERWGALASFLEPGEMAITNGLYAVDDSVFAMYQSGLWRAAEDDAPPPEQHLWRMLSLDGRYVGTWRVPDDFRPAWTGHGVVWGRYLDSAAVPVIQKRRLLPPGGGG